MCIRDRPEPVALVVVCDHCGQKEVAFGWFERETFYVNAFRHDDVQAPPKAPQGAPGSSERRQWERKRGEFVERLAATKERGRSLPVSDGGHVSAVAAQRRVKVWCPRHGELRVELDPAEFDPRWTLTRRARV